jgi:5-methylcytosine-specific restriction protein A
MAGRKTEEAKLTLPTMQMSAAKAVAAREIFLWRAQKFKNNSVAMPNIIPDGINRDHLLEAISRFDAGTHHDFADSTAYDLLHQQRRYPPIAILGIASEILTGEKFTPKHFTGGIRSRCSRVLKENGFELIDKPRNRKHFIQSHGATCANWNWSWSFIHQEKRFIIFGEWRQRPGGSGGLIFSEDWEFRKGIKNKGYNQSREHIRLIEQGEFKLFTFFMDAEEPPDGSGEPVKIKGFEPRLIEKKLKRDGKNWFANESSDPLLSHLSSPSDLAPVGNASPIRAASTTMGFERLSEVKNWVLKNSKGICEYCDKIGPFETSSGEFFLEVHHVRALADGGSDRIENAIAVCPNCHRGFHYSRDRDSRVEKLFLKIARLVEE